MTLLFRPLKIFLPIALFFLVLPLAVWAGGLHKQFKNALPFLAQLGVIALMIGMLADLINVRLRR